MRLKSFNAATLAAAMAAVRAELGDDAIIVATHDDPAGGVRVTAAVEEADTGTDAGALTLAGPAAPTVSELQDVVDTVYRAFRDHGLPAVVGEPLLEAVASFETSDPGTALAAALRQTFRYAPLGDGPWRRPVMLVGPPGAGKTQTVAKLAARGLVAGRRVAVMTTDTDRTGAVTHLAAFTDVLRLQLAVVGDPVSMATGIGALRSCDLIMVDSAGRNHLDSGDMTELARFLLDGAVEPVLVIPGGIDPVEAGDIAMAFRDMGVRRMVLTRLDMTRRLGSVLAAAYAAELAFAELSTTPRIKDGLAPVDPVSLARLVLPNRRAEPRRRQTGT